MRVCWTVWKHHEIIAFFSKNIFYFQLVNACLKLTIWSLKILCVFVAHYEHGSPVVAESSHQADLIVDFILEVELDFASWVNTFFVLWYY